MDDSEDVSRKWQRELPAEPKAIAALLDESNLDLPQSYLDFLRLSDAGEGHLGIEPGWFRLWAAKDVMEANKGYEVQEWLPGFFGFGSNGGGELLAFDTRTSQIWKVYMIPFVSLDLEDATLIADNFADFIKVIGLPLAD